MVDVPTASPTRLNRYHLLLLPAVVLTALLVYLILANHLAARRLRDASDDQAGHEIAQSARSLAAFLTGYLENVADCAASTYVQAFYENRSLGMSPEYGLRLSLSTIGERFDELRKRKMHDGMPVFSGLRLVDGTGAALVDSPAQDETGAGSVERSPPSRAIRDGIDLAADRRHALLSAPVLFHGERVGQVIAWMALARLEHVIGTGRHEHVLTFLATGDGMLRPLGPESSKVFGEIPARAAGAMDRQEWTDDEHRHLQVAARVGETPMWVVIRRTSDRYFGSEPWQSLVLMSALSAVLLGGSVLLMRHMAKTRSLGVLVSVMQEREQVESERNRVTLDREVHARRQAEAERAQLGYAIEQAAESIIITDTAGVILYVNPAFTAITGWAREDVLGKNPRLLKSGLHDEAFYRSLWEDLIAGRPWTGRIVNRHRSGSLLHEHITISPVRDAEGEIRRFVAVKLDITRQVQMEEQLLQAQKLEAIGQLAAGIAHEINTPMQFVSDNLRFLTTGFDDIERVLAELDGFTTGEESAHPAVAALRRSMESADLPYLRAEIPRALGQSLEGVERVAAIVRAMKAFSSSGTQSITPTDINTAIDNTCTVSRSEWRYLAELELKLEPALPRIPLVPGDFNQVMLHLIVNAAQAIEERRRGQEWTGGGHITISTGLDGDHVVVCIEDDGCGIPEAARAHIFEPFFTTRTVGRGTGQGLAFVHAVIVKRLGGTIAFTSTVDVGTAFTLRLPIRGAAPSPEGDAASATGSN